MNGIDSICTRTFLDDSHYSADSTSSRRESRRAVFADVVHRVPTPTHALTMSAVWRCQAEHVDERVAL